MTEDPKPTAYAFLVSNLGNIAAFCFPILAIVVFDVDLVIFYATFFLEICVYCCSRLSSC